MASMPPEFYGAYQYVSQLFAIRPEWLTFPNIITVFLLPLVLNIWMIRIFLEKIVKVFPSTGVNWMIAGVIGFMLLPYNEFTKFIAPLVIGVFGMESTAAKIGVTAFLYALMFLIVPWVANLAVTGFRI